MKQSIDHLAIFGGDPAFGNKLHVGRPNIGDRRMLFMRINDVIDRKWLTNNGPLVEEFEQQIAEKLGVKNCIATCNGTTALQIAIMATGLSHEVIVPSFTFVATAHALKWQNITPVFCDIDPCTHNIDIGKIESLITPQTTGIIGVHTWGRPCDIDSLTKIAKDYKLKLIFDAAHAFMCSYNGKMIGNFGDVEIFSFHATKYINSFEGGAIVTNDDQLAEKLRLMRNFGFAGYDQVVSLGINGKMSEVCAAMGLTSIESLDEIISINFNNYMLYMKEMVTVPGFKLVNYNENEKCNYQYIVFEVDDTITNITRDQIIEILHAENVLARRYFYPGCHRMAPYNSNLKNAEQLLQETDNVANRVICFPTGTSVFRDEVIKICKLVKFIIDNSIEIKEKLNNRHCKLSEADS